MIVLKAFNQFHEIGRCDKRCYNAKNIRCLCCCGGLNHGVGKRRAVKNAAEIVRKSAGISCNVFYRSNLKGVWQDDSSKIV